MGHPSERSDEEGQVLTPGRHTATSTPVEEKQSKHDARNPLQEVPVAVVEQRLSNLVQGILCLVLLFRPFLNLLHLIPRGVLAGLL